jgi:TRAP-type C4-dicarboxylate transport system permease small subunit
MKYIFSGKSISVALGSIFLVLLTVTILFNVVSRYIFNHPFMWGEELAAIFIIWAVYMVFGLNYYEKSSFGIDLITKRLSEKASVILSIFCDAMVLLAIFLIIYYTIVATIQNRHVTIMSLGVPIYITNYLPLLIGCISVILFMANKYVVYKGGIRGTGHHT